ncbi:hypothetical protein SAMN04488583_6386 [Mycobacterium sp. 88mf]|nr:hypothetical protein SAMN04488583_6386 [Mycobacterium sp. 88mf]SFG61761.1 hypothetical protein SAMN04488582_11086 [Mycobacterium sp. 455mf]
MPPPSPVPDWLQIAVAYASVFGSIGVLVAGIALWIQWLRGREERRERALQLTALQRAEDDRIAAQARKIVPEVNSAERFGENIWLAHIENASAGAISNLKVVVSAYDSENNEVPDGIRKATGELDISGGIERIISEALTGGISGVMGANPIVQMLGQQGYGGQQHAMANFYRQTLDQQVGPQVKQAMRHALMGQLQKDWPGSLGPSASATVAYRATRPGMKLHIGVSFEDEAGYLWHRVDTDQPIRVDKE